MRKEMEAQGWENGKYVIDGFPIRADSLMCWNKMFDLSVRPRFCIYFDCSEAKRSKNSS